MRCKHVASRDDRAFTVVELVSASVVLLIVLTAVLASITAAAMSAQMSERRSEALSIANQQIELARNLPFDEVATVVPSNGVPAGKVPGLQTIGAYTAAIDIAYGTYGANIAARYKTIAVVVSWDSPVAGSVTLSSIIAGSSGTQDYNFGIVSLQVQDEGTPASGVAGVIVRLTDANGRIYDVATAANGIATFTYVPSGNITLSATKPGYVVDAPASPTCVANTTTPYGPVIAHALRTGVVKCLSQGGVPVAGVTVGLSGGPNPVSPVLTDASGLATFPLQLIKGTYTIGITPSGYQLTAGGMLTIGAADANTSVTLAVKPATVTATLINDGTVYVWNQDGTSNTSKATSVKKAVFTLTNPDIQPKLYYFTKASTFSTGAPVTVTPGQTYSVAVN
ncbi:MAG TPA: hypothetical protein VIK31_03360 [Propionibacteriaceae bacterium]